MIGAVIRKELRDQRPYAALGMVLVALNVLDELLMRSPDLRPFSATWTGIGGSSGSAWMLVALAFALGSGLLVRELDERTIELLDALPVRRWHLFALKIPIALAVLMIEPVGEVVVGLGLHALSRNSLDRGFHLKLLASWLLLAAAQLLVALSVGVALSFLRRLGWLVLGVWWTLVVALRDHNAWLRLLDPTRLVEPRYSGDGWSWPTRALVAQLGVAALGLAVALLLFSGASDGLLSRIQKRMDRGWVKGIVSAGVVGAVFALLVLSDKKNDHRPPPPSRPFVFRPASLSHAGTRHYDFSFPSDREALAETLVTRADSTYETVAQFLSVSDGPALAADLTGTPNHLAGVTHWGSVRLSLAHPESLVPTLAHETTHALANEIAVGKEQRQTLRQLRAFNEGLASYVEHRFFAPKGLEDARFWVAALQARDDLHFEQLVSESRFLESHDDSIVYPVGELLVDALVKRYGDDSPRKVLDALARTDAPKGLSGLALWSDTFQAAGFPLAVVVDDLYRGADATVHARRAELSRIPRPRAALEDGEDGPVVRPVLDGPVPAGWTVVCRFRPEEGSALEDTVDGDEEGGVFEVPERMVVGGRVWVQLGVVSRAGGHALYEPWAQLTVP